MGLSPFRPGKKEEIESWANWLEAFLDGGDKKQAVEVSKEEEKRRGNELINILRRLRMVVRPEGNLSIDLRADLCNEMAEQFNLEKVQGLMVDHRDTAWVIYMNGEAKQILTVPMASFLLDTIKPMSEGAESEG